MSETLPPFLRRWVEEQAQRMGLPGPDDYLLLVLRLDWQQHELNRLLHAAPLLAGPAA